MRILGIDPGYAIVGYGVLDVPRGGLLPVAFGAVTTRAHTAFVDRLYEVYQDITHVIEKYRPDAMAIETLFYTSNQKTVMEVAEARGVILLAAKTAEVPIFEYTPLQVKQSVSGYGRASKKQMQEMTRRLLCLSEIPKPDDAADALAMAICHAHSCGSLQYGKAETKRRKMGYY